jgi:quercetin dioxygenase-like cupin family protein
MSDATDPTGRAPFSSGNAVEMIATQPGAVVSREIARKKGGTVTLFAFDAGQGLSEHTSPFDALVLVVDGTADVTIGGTTRRLGKDDMTRMPAGVPHALAAVTPFKMLLVMIRDTPP